MPLSMPVEQWAAIKAETIVDAFVIADGADDLVCLYEAIIAALREAYALGLCNHALRN